MRKFTYKDTADWKIVDVQGQTLVLVRKNKDGEVEEITRFDGYRSAAKAAVKLGGTAVRV